MGTSRLLIACALLQCFVALVRGDSDPWGSFIFPPNSTVTDFTAEAPIVANITADIHFNDEMVIEYTLPDTVKSLWVKQSCFGAVNDTNVTSENSGTGFSYTQTTIYNESTGNLLWYIGNGTFSGGSYSDINYCYFTIWDYTIQNCSWGPFGLTGWNVGGTYTSPLLFSQMFRIMPPASDGPFLNVMASTTTQNPPPVTAKPASVTCPPSGIPAAPITTSVPQMEMIPPLANNLTFPDWVYTSVYTP